MRPSLGFRLSSRLLSCCLLVSVPILIRSAPPPDQDWARIAPFFAPPPEFAGDFGSYRSPLLRPDGSAIRTPAEWIEQRRSILTNWFQILGPWPPLIPHPKIEIIKQSNRDGLRQSELRIELAPGQLERAILLDPGLPGKHPAVLVVFYDPETSAGLASTNRDFAFQLSKRGFVTLSLGSPGGDARKPPPSPTGCQPLSYLAYMAVNAATALSHMPQVDPKRIGITGHSYGGKWAMFASCLSERFACAAWSDPGIVFDDTRPNINYWEPWYLGLAPGHPRRPGLPSPDNPVFGAYKLLRQQGHDLHELHVLMAPRPFLVSGGAEDPPDRWRPLNYSIAVNQLFGFTNRVALTHRPHHEPTAESNQQIYSFFSYFLNRDQ